MDDSWERGSMTPSRGARRSRRSMARPAQATKGLQPNPCRIHVHLLCLLFCDSAFSAPSGSLFTDNISSRTEFLPTLQSAARKTSGVCYFALQSAACHAVWDVPTAWQGCTLRPGPASALRNCTSNCTSNHIFLLERV